MLISSMIDSIFAAAKVKEGPDSSVGRASPF